MILRCDVPWIQTASARISFSDIHPFEWFLSRLLSSAHRSTPRDQPCPWAHYVYPKQWVQVFRVVQIVHGLDFFFFLSASSTKTRQQQTLHDLDSNGVHPDLIDELIITLKANRPAVFSTTIILDSDPDRGHMKARWNNK